MQRSEKEGLTVLPLFIKPCPWKQVPWLSGIQGFPLGNKTLFELSEPEQLRILTQFAESICTIVHPAQIQPEPEKVMDIGSCLGSANKTPRNGAQRGGGNLLTPLPPRKVHLIGRENDLVALAEMLKKTERVVLVNGLGGIGKTEVCKFFFYSHYNQYDYAAWIDWISSLKESLLYQAGPILGLLLYNLS